MSRNLAAVTFTIATLVATSTGIAAVFENRASNEYAEKLRDAAPAMVETYKESRDDARRKAHIYGNIAIASGLLAVYTGARALKKTE